MFDGQSLVDLSKKVQRQIVVMIMLAVALAEKGRSISRYEAAALCRVSELVRKEVRKDLEEFFTIHTGRITFRDKDSQPKPWEIEDSKTDRPVVTARIENYSAAIPSPT
jgi:hypothetical protein